MMRRLRMPLFAALLVLGAVAIACSGDSKSSAPATAAVGTTTLNVTLTEFEVKLDKSEAAAGQTVIKTKNGGSQDHELRVIPTDVAADKLPLAGAVVDESKVRIAGKLEQLKPLSNKDLTVKL